MAYIVISDFRFGLDKRRLDLANRPGALSDLVNAHITNGGEIEKRKAFTRTSLVNTSFGLEALKDSLVVFGSAADPGGWPTGVTYQRLQHPQSLVATLTSVVHSTVYGGKVFAIAEFSDGSRWMYYDGTILDDNRYGLIYGVLTLNVNLAAEIVANITSVIGSFYSATQQAFPNNDKVDLYGQPGRLYTVTVSKTSTLGTLTAALVDNGIPGVPATSAIGAFQIVAGSEVVGHQITQIAVGVTNLLLAPVLYNDGPERTASDVAVAINTNSGTSGYSATASGGVVIITAVATGTAANDLDITVTSAIDVCVGLCKFNFVGTGFSLDYITVDGVNIMTAVLNYPTPVGETIAAFCVRVAANVNANTGVSGYLAAALGNAIFLSKAVTKATDADKPVSISVSPTTGTGAVYIGTLPSLLVTLNTYFVSAVIIATGVANTNRYQSSVVTAQPVGGTPPFSYQWLLVEALDTADFFPVTPTAQSTVFQFFGLKNAKTSFHAFCRVTDAIGETFDSPQVTIST